MLKTNNLKCLFAALTLTFALPPAARSETVTEYLRAFHKNPAQMMERLPSVVGENGEATPRGFIDENAVAARLPYINEIRSEITGLDFRPGAAAPDQAHDSADNLLDPGFSMERNLPDMQAQSLLYVSAQPKPWADSYWPTYKGQIAYRYADRLSPNSKSWSENRTYAESNPASRIVSEGDTSRINLLSPAEKYDFVMGDPDWSLTKYAWDQGTKQSDNGGVATWIGICHGWAAAAHLGAPFVGQPVTVIAQNGIPVIFYPQDIKALQTMLWANGKPSSRFVGTRCTISHPARNANGRILDRSCFDTNPATWHLAVVNRLGRDHRGFAFDGTYDAEVWNFPIASARYRYFNPETLEDTGSLANAMIPIANFRIDKFREFRSPNARNIVGIYMDVTYVIEIEPGVSRVFDAPTKTVRYIYDLELDAGNNVIGGEWYSNAHPDFIWTFENSAQAMAFDENVLLTDPWANNGPVPLNWTPYARKASARGIPLYAFIKKVIDAAGPVHQP